MNLGTLKPSRGSKKNYKRTGRGPGSGKGKTAAKGHKGQKARSGGVKGPGFEGGQMPIIRLVPKRGFFNFFSKSYTIVNIGQLGGIKSNTVVDPIFLKEKGIVKGTRQPVKILGEGELKIPLTVQANAFSKKAVEKILSAGGKAEVI